MSERLQSCQAAYTRGVNASKQRKRRCPYDEHRKRELHDWWHRGWSDYAADVVDIVMYRDA